MMTAPLSWSGALKPEGYYGFTHRFTRARGPHGAQKSGTGVGRRDVVDRPPFISRSWPCDGCVITAWRLRRCR
jgi:hypothetical protein